MPVDDVAELLRRWREAGGAWSRGRVLLDAAQLAGRLTPEERRTVAAALADTGAPDLARQLESRTGQPVDATHLQAFADGLLELEGARLEQVITALELADARPVDAGSDGAAVDDRPEQAAPRHARPEVLPPPPPGPRGAVTPQDEALDERLRDLAALEHLGDEELQGIRLGEIELGGQELGRQELGGQELGQTDLVEVGLGEARIAEVGLQATAGVTATTATARQADRGALDQTPTGDRGVSDRAPSAERDEPEPTPTTEPEPTPAAEPEPSSGVRPETAPAAHPAAASQATGSAAATPDGSVASDELGAVALVPAADAPDELTPRAAAEALATVSGRLTDAASAGARFAALSPDVVRELDAPAALLALDRVPAGWQRRRVARRLFAAGALAGVDPSALLARFPDARDRRFVAADLLATSDLAATDLADDLPPQVVRRLAIRAER
jgi:hypothetical protein